MNSKSHSLKSIAAIALFTFGVFFVVGASFRHEKSAPASGGGQRVGIYAVTGFTFSTPLELTGHPPSPAFFQQDAEPEIKIDIFGNIYVTAIQGVPGGVDFWKSTNKGATFVYLGQPDGAQDHCSSPTPQCLAAGGGDDSIDVSNGGFLYVASLWAGNVTMSTSMDGGTGGTIPGQAWQVIPAASNVPVDDRQWVAAYGPQTVYMTLRQAPGTGDLFVFKSTDGGKTFATTTAGPITGIVSREGNLVVDKYTGNLYTTYIPNGITNQIVLLSSVDGGATWNSSTAYTAPAGTSVGNAFTVLAVDRGGNLHLAFALSNGVSPNRTSCHVYLMSTANPAVATPTWTAPVQVDSGPQNNTAVIPWIVAGSPGVVDVTWYGSTISSPDVTPNSSVASGQWWNVFFGQVTNALSATPTIAQTIVAANVHNLSICSSGTGCVTSPTASSTRKLLEYYTITVDPDGNANIAFPDSVDNCPSSTCLTNSWFVKQTAGPSAYSPPAPPPPATFAANVALSNGGTSAAEPGMQVDSHNCLFTDSPGGGGRMWKSTDNGLTWAGPISPVVSSGLVGGDEELLPFPQASGARPDQLYFADLGVTTVHISKSINGGATHADWFKPGTNGAAGEVSASVDRQWLSGDRSGANQTVYLWEHEFVSQELRMSALTNDTAWSPFASGITTPELIAPPGSTLSNTNPGPTFVDPATHQVYGFFCASTVTSNTIGAPTGKLPNIWEADGAGTFTSPVPPGPFTNHPVFKGVFDSPTSPAPPAGSATIGSNTGNLFNGAAIDSAGNIYVTWATPNARNGRYELWFASSHDHGATYYGPFKINPPGIQATSPWMAAGDNGRVDIVFYGTAGTEDPSTTTNDQWNVMFAQSLNAADHEPVFTTSQASDHVNHIGQICNVGILCGSNTRNLLDFFKVAIGPDGLANIAYADTGAQPAGSQTSSISFARQNSGPLALTNPTSPTCLGNIVPLTSVVSRKTHGSAGMFDVNLPLIGTRGVECRSGGTTNDYKLVFTFANNLVSVGGVSVTGHDPASGTGSVNGTAMGPNPNQYTVNLTNVSNAQYITVKLNSVVDSTGNAADVVGPQMGVLVGDVNGNGIVSNGDVSAIQAQVAQTVTSSNFRDDVNANGVISNGDVSLTQAQVGQTLPTSP